MGNSVHIACETTHSCTHLVECKSIPDNQFSILNKRNRGKEMMIFSLKILRDDSAQIQMYVCMFSHANKLTWLTWEGQHQAHYCPMRHRRSTGPYLGGADEATLVLAPVHTQHLVAMTLQDTLGLYGQLTHHFHLLSHLVHWHTNRERTQSCV